MLVRLQKFLADAGVASRRASEQIITAGRVTVEGRVEPGVLQQMTRGIYHNGEKLRADRAWLLSAAKKQSVVELELSEGKNREVRRLFETQRLTVERLQRIQIGRIKLGELP